jgi:hypothetical protein
VRSITASGGGAAAARCDRCEARGGGIGLPFGGGGGLGVGTVIVLGLIGYMLGIDPRILIGGAEEELVSLLPGQQDHMLVGELEGADIPALLAQTIHQADRIGAELLEVPMLVGTAGDASDVLQLRVTGHDSSGYFSC